MNAINIAGRMVGLSRPCFIIAEIGVNHDGEMKKACQLVDVAVEAGADAVKFQTFVASRLASSIAPKADYQMETTSREESQVEMLRRLELSPQDHRELIGYCRQKNILIMSTPFDEDSADLLDELKVSVFKVPSGEITNLSFLDHVARKGKPMIVSTGMATLGEVESAVRAVEHAGNEQIVLLHCVSSYPACERDVNLRAMQTMADAFRVPVGYSDHTLGIEVALGAVALGACVIEKHVTLDRTLSGPDHRCSLDPEEFSVLVRGIRKVEKALGDGIKKPVPMEMAVAAVARKSLVAAKTISAGTMLTGDMLALRRPGTGLPPSMRSQLVGRRAKRGISEGALLTLDMWE